MKMLNRSFLGMALLALSVSSASAQTPGQSDDWQVAVYPIMGWLPVFGADVTLPSGPGGGGGGGGEGSSGGKIDSKFEGALLGGISVARGPWRADADAMWAALTGDRPTFPKLQVDLDIVYGHVSGGRKVVKDLYVIGGVRRVALNYDIQLGDLEPFSRKPGIWDPLIGVAWHRVGQKMELHATFEGGGFGVGADKDISGSFRMDWKPISHVGLTFGYAGIHLEITDTVLSKTFTASQTLHGPILGFGLYF